MEATSDANGSNRLRSLHLQNNGVDDEVAVRLSLHWRRPMEIHLSANLIGDVGGSALARRSLAQMPWKLASQQQYRRRCRRQLWWTIGATSLQQLNLNCNRIGDIELPRARGRVIRVFGRSTSAYSMSPGCEEALARPSPPAAAESPAQRIPLRGAPAFACALARGAWSRRGPAVQAPPRCARYDTCPRFARWLSAARGTCRGKHAVEHAVPLMNS